MEPAAPLRVWALTAAICALAGGAAMLAVILRIVRI
jgi:hypothetical protein